MAAGLPGTGIGGMFYLISCGCEAASPVGGGWWSR